MGHASSTPYQDRDDCQKIQSQWLKIDGLLKRHDWAAAVVRAATAAEIAANLVIRHEFADRSQFDEKVVNSFLRWANGIDGKVRKLIIPLLGDRAAGIDKLFKSITDATEKRNLIVHSGEFCDEAPARQHIAACKVFVEALVTKYHLEFKLTEAVKPPASKDAKK
jgi:hypothetical protein